MNHALKESTYAKLAQKEGKYQVLDLQKKDVQNNAKLPNLESSVRFNMQQLRENHDVVLNIAKDNGTMWAFEEIDKLRQTLEEK